MTQRCAGLLKALAHPSLVVSPAHRSLAVGPLQATHDEMSAGERLKMIDEGGVDRRATDRPDNRNGLGGDLLRDHYTKPEPIWASRRTMAEALSSTTPRPAICCRARVTDFAIAARTAK